MTEAPDFGEEVHILTFDLFTLSRQQTHYYRTAAQFVKCRLRKSRRGKQIQLVGPAVQQIALSDDTAILIANAAHPFNKPVADEIVGIQLKIMPYRDIDGSTHECTPLGRDVMAWACHQLRLFNPLQHEILDPCILRDGIRFWDFVAGYQDSEIAVGLPQS